eukprot:COSAG01_NODE_9055_length_2568_cov_24.871203_2_plen_210_part_00
MGLFESVSILLQEKGVSYKGLGTFALCTWPFAVKLLWAPLVDSVYRPAWGRRKSWFVPAQLLAGALFVWAGQPTQVDELFGGVPAGGSGEGPNVAKLTATFFATYLLMATQVRASPGGGAPCCVRGERGGGGAKCRRAADTCAALTELRRLLAPRGPGMQDIAVDGWALTILSPAHVEKGSTMNSIGAWTSTASNYPRKPAPRHYRRFP